MINSRVYVVYKENVVLLECRLSVVRDFSFFEKSKKFRFFCVKCFDFFES